jgi:hypothetical protein
VYSKDSNWRFLLENMKKFNFNQPRNYYAVKYATFPHFGTEDNFNKDVKGIDSVPKYHHMLRHNQVTEK